VVSLLKTLTIEDSHVTVKR